MSTFMGFDGNWKAVMEFTSFSTAEAGQFTREKRVGNHYGKR